MNLDLRSIVLFLNLQGKSKKAIGIEINNTLQKKAIAYSTVTKYLRENFFSSDNKDDGNSNENFEHLLFQQIILKVLNDYPFSSIREIEDMTNIPKTTVHRILTQELHFVSCHLKWVPHNLNSTQKVARVELSKGLLSTLEKAVHQSYQYFFTGDESWIYLSNDHKLQWVQEGESPSTREKKMIGSKKFMLTVFWNTEGFIIIDLLPEGLKFNSEYFINNILERIYQMTSDLCLKSRHKITLHFDNARVHTARKVIQYMDLHRMKRAPHPPFSPDIAASDFYLFGFLKDRLAGQVFESADELFEGITQILNKIPQETLKNVFHEWEERLRQVIEKNGEYI